MDKFAPPPTLSKAERIARKLLIRMAEASLQADDSLGTETELLTTYSVSRPTLRESLRILENLGVITLRPGPGGGIRVRRPAVDSLVQSLSVFLSLNKVPYGELLRTRMAVEPQIAREAAVRGNETHFGEIEALIRRMEWLGDGRAEFRLHKQQVHGVLARAAGNPVLEAFAGAIMALNGTDAPQVQLTPEYRAGQVEGYRRVLASCRARDADEAERQMAALISGCANYLSDAGAEAMEAPVAISFRWGR